ncbi:MAG: hypothetical protein WCW44_01505 [archaeon]|jgi:hypothetical protein
MQNTFFLKEPISYADKNVSFVALNQKQLKPAIDFTTTTFLAQDQTNVILVSFTQNPQELISNIPQQWRKKLFIIDAFSKEDQKIPQVSHIDNASDLTSIMIAIEKVQKNLDGKIIILFDAINMLSIYNKKDTLGKFIHIFCNKTRLEEKTAILFTVKESTDDEILELLNEFVDKAYDFSSLFISAISTLSE